MLVATRVFTNELIPSPHGAGSGFDDLKPYGFKSESFTEFLDYYFDALLNH